MMIDREEITVTSKNGNDLSTILAVSDQPSTSVVIVSHGYDAKKDESAFELTDLGYDVVIFDYQGCGDSEGDFEKKTVTRDIEDLTAVIDYFDKDEGVIIYGSSFKALLLTIIFTHPL